MRDVIRLAFLGILGAGLVLPQVISAQTAKPRSSAANAGGALVNGDWAYVGHDAGGMRYSPLKQINVDNVKNLRVAWTYHVGDISDGKGFARRSGFETTPILVDGTLFLTTPFNRVIALDPESGTPCADFGNRGQVSLRDVARYQPGRYHMTSAPEVIDDLVVVGSAIDDNSRADMPGGVVRAYNARTGRLAWKWEPLPPNDNSKSSDTQNPNDNGPQRATKIWRTGAGNAWTGMAVDADRGLVFVPTGSASPDYYGGLRLGDDKWADSIVALRAKTGEMAWGFQLVHHDLWDYDTASPPLLATVKHDGKDVPVVVQGNKTGFLYVLNRDTGVPVFPVEEKPVPQSDVPGEVTSPTQPFPSAPPALVPQSIVASDA